MFQAAISLDPDGIYHASRMAFLEMALAGITTVGEVPGEFVKKVSEGAVDFPWPAQVANLLATGGHDLVLSIGQVVPHEVIGMANYNKNIFVGTGGSEGINKSHFVGAAYGCLAPRMVTGEFDAQAQKAVWPSTGNYCRGGAYDSNLLACESIAILPEGMRLLDVQLTLFTRKEGFG